MDIAVTCLDLHVHALKVNVATVSFCTALYPVSHLSKTTLSILIAIQSSTVALYDISENSVCIRERWRKTVDMQRNATAVDVCGCGN